VDHRSQKPPRYSAPFESCGYTPIRNDAAKDGQWKIAGTRQTVYAKKTMLIAEQLKAARRLTEQD